MCLLPSLKWSSTVSSLGIVKWDFTRRGHPRNPGRVSGSGPVRGGSTTPDRGRSRGEGGRSSTPISQIQSGTRTQAQVFTVTQQESDASRDMITGIISVYDHYAYALVDPGATHSFI